MHQSHLETLQNINQMAAFNRWAGFEVTDAGEGTAELSLDWHDGLGQYAGFLHAGITGGLIDTACGFAAVTICGPVLASHYSTNMIAPAIGERFITRAHVIKAGRRQVFASAEMFAIKNGEEKLVATGSAVLVPLESNT